MKHYAGLAFLRQWVRLSCLFISIGGFSQDIAVGSWRTHFSYRQARLIATTPDKIFCAVETGLFSREIATGSIRKLSKIDGLSDVKVSALAYSPDENALIIGYESGFVDIVKSDEIISVSDIARSSLDVEKQVNDIAIENGIAFLATSFGVVVINISTGEVQENFIQIGDGGQEVRVLRVLVRQGKLFILTEDGVQVGDLSKNLLDFNNWEREVLSGGTHSELVVVDDQIYVQVDPLAGLEPADGRNDDLLFVYRNGDWEETGISFPDNTQTIFSVQNELVTAALDGTLYRLANNSFQSFLNVNGSEINDLEVVNGNYIIADEQLGLIDEQGNPLSPDGPISNAYSRVRVEDSKTYGFHAPALSSYSGSQKVEGFSVFSDGVWTEQSIADFPNVSDVAAFNSNRYFTSIGFGLYNEADQQIIRNIPESTGTLDTLLTGIKAGADLWIAGVNAQEPVHILSQDGEWTSLSSTELSNSSFTNIDLSSIGVAWIQSSSGTISLAYPEENLFDVVSSADGVPSAITDFNISIEDNAWVATPRGPATFPNASFIFNNTQAIAPSFDNRLLFESEEINAVMTDGGNRVWFGTNRGVWVFDENTSSQVAIFNEENSPLPSDVILDLEYNGRNGEVFIVTDRGMVSFRSASSIGARSHRDVSIFPNPVRPDYQGMVGITGLARNATVKVTDINGNLVNEIVGNGASAAWDLRDLTGSKVSAGIYFFFSSDADGTETHVGKIAVIR